MQSEWSTGSDGSRDPSARTEATGPAAATGPVPATAGTAGEEELHRSAVDAVDGLLDEVEQALGRLDDGTYGRCEACGEPIDDERLAELPIVRTCGACDGVDAEAVPASAAAPGPAAD